MKKLIMSISAVMFTVLIFSTTVYAYTVPSGEEPAPVVEEAGGGGGGGEGEGPAPQPAEPKEPSILSYTPVVTALHSINAAFASEGTAVYFMPQLEDFPVNLADSCSNITTEDGQEHKFALVYDGYFDTEVAYNLAQNDNTDTTDVTRLQTSKKVYSQTDNSRTLNLLGYDLLLADERASIVTSGENINMEYFPTLVGTAPLTTKTIMMDLYKAVGVYEWDIKVVFGIDETLAVNTSPIMQQIAVLTNDEIEGGIDTREGATYVWATRTNPDIYWTRCKRDSIFDGGAHLYTKSVYVGNATSVSFSKNETQTMTMGEFCQVARAVMELYGEPVLTEVEIERMLQAYALTLPVSDTPKEQADAIRYLAAKGIIDPDGMSWAKNVTFADIEEILLRIADENSRLTFKFQVNADSTMVRAGYAKVPIANVDNTFTDVEEIINPFDSDYYDYFIEAVDGKTNFYLNKLSGVDLTQQDNLISTDEESERLPSPSPGASPSASPIASPSPSPGNQRMSRAGTIPTDPIIQDGKEYAFACDKLMVAGADSVPTTAGSGYFEYLGLYEYDDRYYYHFKISRELTSITIQYDADPELEMLLDITEYSLPSAEGGVYNFSEDLPEYATLDEYGFSYEYIDAEREEADVFDLAETESYLAQYTWMKVMYKIDVWNAMVKGTNSNTTIISYYDGNSKIVVAARDLEEARGTGERRFEDNGGNVWWVYEDTSAGSQICCICQTKMTPADFKKALAGASASISDTQAYYRAEDGTLLASYDYLKKQGLCSNLQNLRSGSGIMISTNSGNVSLRSDLDLIIVGDTAIPANGELLYYQEGENYYINVKACMGWSGNYTTVNNNKALIPIFRNNLSSTTTKVNFTSTSVYTYFPSSSVNAAYINVKAASSPDGSGEGFSLSGSNPLGCYMVVYDFDHDTDWLFVWHRNDVVGSDGGTHSVGEDGARSKFSSLTGINVGSVSSDYSLKCFQLNRNNQGNPAGMKYLYFPYSSSSGYEVATFGYAYMPPEFSTMDQALSTYISGSEGCALPIAKVNGKIVNLNLNTCTDMEGNSQLPIGTMPMYLQSSSAKDSTKMGSIQPDGKSVKETSATYDNLDSVKLLASPVGLFQIAKGLGTRSVAEWSKNSGTIYFGSSKCKVQSDALTINGHKLEFDTNAEAVCTLLGTGAKSVYVINEDSSSVGQLLSEKLEDIGMVVTDPEALIDWSAYKFGRLVQNLDDWTSILLIFVLNVLPRIGMLLFFALMLLSLIKDVKFWRSFCVNHFDIYSFLTMGKQNVDTVDMKRIVLISLICFSIFLVIMDGQLFNFIIFICRIFINITQR